MNAKVRTQVCNTVISWGIGPMREGGNQAEFGVVTGVQHLVAQSQSGETRIVPSCRSC